ncbi:hypothetical protein FACS189459_5060 [Bacilli bacterium]|nr:hypothetical protein FACS189459_5060 [Bacilli bacterium]
MISLYSIGEGIAFGILFFAVHLSSEYDLSGLSFVFLIGGGLFCVSGLIGSILSQKAAFTLGKFLM